MTADDRGEIAGLLRKEGHLHFGRFVLQEKNPAVIGNKHVVLKAETLEIGGKFRAGNPRMNKKNNLF